MIYRDGKSGTSYIKRFAVTGVTRDKEYGLTQGNPGSKVLYFSANPNGEAEIVSIILRQSGSIKKLKWDLDFADLDIKGRGVKGNIVTKYRVNRIELKEAGVSTLKPRKIWFDESVQRLNVDGRGTLVGAFRGDDKLLIIQQNGTLKTVTPDLSMHFPEDMIVMEQWSPKKPLSVIYFDGEKERYYVKRFLVENANKEETIVRDHSSVRLELVSTDWKPQVELVFAKPRGKEPRPNQQVVLEEFIDVKGIKALGNQLTPYKVKTINNLEPIPYDPPPPTATPDIEVNSEEVQADSSAKEVSSSNSDNSSDGEGQISMEL
jgi:topoisomerase-4 subunit A